MAENLTWLARERFPTKKIIIWAASSHIMRKPGNVGVAPMGQYISEAFPGETYSIAFTAYRGAIGRAGTIGGSWLTPAVTASLEALLHAAGEPYAFVDLRSLAPVHWLRQPISARPLGYVPRVWDWTSYFDAFFFTDVMFPSTQ